MATARLLEPNEYGLFTLALTVLGIACVVSDFGVGESAVVRLTGAEPGLRTFRREVVPARFALAVPWAVAGGVLCVVAQGELQLVGVALLGLPGIALLLATVQQARIAGDFARVARWTGAVVLAQSVGGAAVSLWRPSAAYALAGSTLAVLAAAAGTIHRTRPTRARPESLKRWLKVGRPYVVTGVAVVLYSRLDRVLLAWLGSAADVGQYVAAYTPALLAAVVGQALYAAVLPRFLTEVNKGVRVDWLRRLAKLTMATSAVALLQVVLAPVLVQVVFGAEYRDAAALMRLLAPLTVLYVVNPMLAAALLALGQPTRLSTVATINVAVASVLYPLLINEIGAAGAALGSVLVELGGTILAASFVMKIATGRQAEVQHEP